MQTQTQKGRSQGSNQARPNQIRLTLTSNPSHTDAGQQPAAQFLMKRAPPDHR